MVPEVVTRLPGMDGDAATSARTACWDKWGVPKKNAPVVFLNANGINSSNNMTSGINDGNNIYNSNPYNTTNGIIVITNGIND
jgi:exopolysaccharide biosynthesis protein